MATDVERLIVALEARTKAFENALNRANGISNSRARQIESRFARMNKTLSAGFSTVATSAVKAFALIGGAQGARNLIDAATRIDNALKVAGLSGEELESVYNRLLASAQKNAAPLETLVTLYSRAAATSKELGASQEDLLNFTDKISLALRVSGQSAEESSGALLQLSQALGNGVVQAEEYNSLLDGGRPILQAVAAGLKEAGGSVSGLTKLVKDGKVSSEAFFRAFLAGAPVLEDQVAGSVLTIDQRLGNLQTSLIDAARRFNESTEVSNTFGQEIDRVSAFVNGINFDSLVSEISAVINALNSGIQAANSFANSISQLSGLSNVGKAIVDALPGDTTVKSYLGGALTIKQNDLIEDRINDAFKDSIDNAVRQTGDLTADAIRKSALGQGTAATQRGGRLPAAAPTNTVTPVSLGDFKAPSSRGGGSGGGRGGRSRQDDFQRESAQVKERTVAIQAETAAMSKLNPLVEDYGYSVDFARTKQDLLTAAQQAGVKITPEVEASIDAMAEGYAKATSAAEKLSKTQDKARERAEFFAETTYDAFSELIPQIETGNAALDKFLNTLIEAVAQAALLGKGPLAAAGGGGGLLGGLFSIFGFASGGIAARGRPLKRFASGGVSRSAAIFGEAGPEAAVPLPDGRRIPVDLRLPDVSRSGGSTYAPVYQIDARGADQAAVVRLERGLAERDRTESKRVAGYNQRQQVRKVRP